MLNGWVLHPFDSSVSIPQKSATDLNDADVDDACIEKQQMMIFQMFFSRSMMI